MALFKKFDKQIPGRLFAVGDLHGCYSLLMNKLHAIGFDFDNDHLVSVGDLVDRGAENMQCIELLSKPWFSAVRGNHEDLCIGGLHDEAYKRCHISNGGQWFYMLDGQAMYNIAKVFAELPVALEVEHKGKKFGFVHGHIEHNDWEEFKREINSTVDGRDVADYAMWGRERFGDWENTYPPVENVHAVILGHSVSPQIIKRQNCYFIDTGAVHYGTLTVLNLDEV
ncbi:metallophosphoesterase [Acinetobacter thermotolerans]|uniref:metallophosphoesterase n=1 Tax=Acinetobacter thermotolerans TaxID=3151487 RepID=UPI00325AED3E